MKKLFIIIFMMFLTFNLIQVVNASDHYFLNNNGITMSRSEYVHLQKFGLSDDEIYNMNEKDFTMYMSRTIKSNFVVKYNVETTYTYEDDKLISQENKYLSDDEMKVKVQEAKNSKDKNLQKSDGSTVVTPYIIVDGGGLGGGSSDIIRDKYEVDDYKTFYLYGVFYSDQGNYGEFSLRVEVDWLVAPYCATYQSFVDLITIGFMTNVMLKETYISGQYYPSLHSHFEYNRETYVEFDGSYTYTEYNIDVYGNDIYDYKYNPTTGILGFEYEMPYVMDGQGGYVHNSDLKMTVDTDFTVTDSSINGTTFSAWYSHQIGSGHIDWGQISISPTYPYFSYSTRWWINDPNFDDGIGGNIIFQDIGN